MMIVSSVTAARQVVELSGLEAMRPGPVGDVGRAFRVAPGVQSGSLPVNSHSSVRYRTPFGGFKHSGIARELGPDASNR